MSMIMRMSTMVAIVMPSATTNPGKRRSVLVLVCRELEFKNTIQSFFRPPIALQVKEKLFGC